MLEKREDYKIYSGFKERFKDVFEMLEEGKI